MCEVLEDRRLLSGTVAYTDLALPAEMVQENTVISDQLAGGSLSSQITTAPVAVSIQRATPSGRVTEAASVSYAVTFSRRVAGVSASNFKLLLGSGVSVSSPLVVCPASGYNSVYIVTVSGISGHGTLRLNLVNVAGIRDAAGARLPSPNGTFQSQQTFAVGAYPSGVIAADVNRDGTLDMVVANYADTTVSVLRGNGDGTFQPQQTFYAGSGANGLAAADLDGDGKLDLAVADMNGGVSVLRGNGDGTFQYPQSYSVGSDSYPRSIAVADVNGDGKSDLIVAAGNNTVAILLGNGNGTFQAAQSFAAGTWSYGVVVADVSGDGKLDVVVSDYRGSGVDVLLGNGDGTFQTAQVVSTGSSVSTGLAAADLNGDGNLDLVVANGDNTMSVMLGNGNGTFAAEQMYAINSLSFGVTLADLNADNKLDVVVTDERGTVSVLLGNGDGTFAAQQSYAAGSSPSHTAVADVNGDGAPDLIVSNSAGSGTLSVLLGNRAFTTVIGQAYMIDHAPAGISLAPARVAENQPAGTVVGELAAADPDSGDSFTYKLIRTPAYPDNAAFAIAGNQLRTARELNFETQNSYSIRVQVTDRAGKSFARTLTVRVNNVNEAPTDIVLSGYTVRQHQPVMTLVGSFGGTDPDAGNTLTYLLVGGAGSRDNARFMLMRGQLRTASVFDYGTKSVYKIRVRVTDQGGLWYEKAIRIGVTYT